MTLDVGVLKSHSFKTGLAISEIIVKVSTMTASTLPAVPELTLDPPSKSQDNRPCKTFSEVLTGPKSRYADSPPTAFGI